MSLWIVKLGMRFQSTCLIFLLFLCTGCSQAPPEPGQAIKWDQVSGDFVNNRVSLEGYVTVPKSIMATDTLLLPLRKELESEEPIVRFSTKIGSGNNQVEALPKKYKESDFKLKDKDGNLIAPKSKIRVSGKLIGDQKAWILMGPLLIEKL